MIPDWKPCIRGRLAALSLPPEREAEISEEIAQHLDDRYQEMVGSGAAGETARLAVLAELDDRDLRAALSRHERGAPGDGAELGAASPRQLSGVAGDFRYAVRALRRTPGFAAGVVVTLALGIGANTAIFSVVNTVVLRPLPYPEAERLVVVWDNLQRHGLKDIDVSALEFTEIRDRNRVFERVAAYSTRGFNISDRSQPERVNGAEVTARLFPLLGTSPALGRGFGETDQEPGRRVAVISHDLWQRLFAGDAGIVGKPVAVEGAAVDVVGVMPAGFHFPDESIELWLPVTFDAGLLSENNRGSRAFTVLGRLKTGVSVEQAQSGMNAVTEQMVKEHPVDYQGGYSTTVRNLHDEVVGGTGRLLFLQLGAVACVLLIGCANVANLLLARAASRRKEMAVRTALGAKRSRIVRQLLTESMLLGMCGGALGLFVAVWGVGLLVALAPADIPRLGEVSLDARVVTFTAVVSILTAILFGTVPALHASRLGPGEALREGGRTNTSATRRGFGKALIVSEVALSLVLLVAAGLLISSFARLQEVRPGFAADHLLTLRVAPPPSQYTFAKGETFYADLCARLRAMPGVRDASATNALPLSGFRGDRSFYVEGRAVTRPEDQADEQLRFVRAGYFATMQIPVLEGREFTDRDVASSPRVAIVNVGLARKFWPDRRAIGGRVAFSQQEPTWYEIVGVAGNIKHNALDAQDTPELYVPVSQPLFAGAMVRPMFIIVRTQDDPLAIVPSVRRAVAAIDPDLPVSDVRSMEQRVTASLSSKRFNMLLLALFAALALLLSAVGVYGLVAYAVSERTHELGVRLALGARPVDVIAMLVGEGMTLAGAGAAAGGAVAVMATRVMRGLLFGVEATDPATFAVVTVLLATVTLCACYVPARRATRVDPVTALRTE